MDEYDYGLVAGDSFAPDDEVDEPFDPRRPHVMTVLGPVEPAALGMTLPHEHLLCRPATIAAGDPDTVLDDPYRTLTALEAFHQSGGGAIVDMSTAEYGRDIEGLVWLARRSPVHVIATTGHHKASYLGTTLDGLDHDVIAGRSVSELEDGVGETGVRPGVIKAGTSRETIEPVEDRVLRAAAEAHLATGVPISTHTDHGTMALAQVAILTGEGVSADRVILGHLDRLGDHDEVIDILARGTYGSVDQIGKGGPADDERRADLVTALVVAGHGDRVLLSQDLSRRSLIPAYGGSPGWSHLPERFVLLLMDRGLTAPAIHRLVATNPQSALTVRRPS